MRRSLKVMAAVVASVLAAVAIRTVGTHAAAPAKQARPAVVVAKSEKEYAATVVRVDISNYAFSPERVVIKPDTTVVWTQRDYDLHNVHLFASRLNGLKEDIVSDMLARGQTFAVTFYEAGTYEYQCDPHPIMTGTVIVKTD